MSESDSNIPASASASAIRPSPLKGLWMYQERDKAVARALLDGASAKEVAAHFGMQVGHVYFVLRRVCERQRPDWVDSTGRNRAWGTPLSQLRAQREAFSL